MPRLNISPSWRGSSTKGRPTGLWQLDMTMTMLDEQIQVNEDFEDISTPFPHMLSLRNARDGRPGFLSYLSRLTKLERLSGSVRHRCGGGQEDGGLEEGNLYERALTELSNTLTFFKCLKYIRAPFIWSRNRYKRGCAELKLPCER